MRNLLSILAVCLLTMGCAGWTFNGIDLQEIDDAPFPDLMEFIAGGVLSVGVHFGSHVAYLESSGIDWHIEGRNEVIERPWELTPSQMGWAGRSGTVGQLLVGYVLNYGPWGDAFKDGFLLKGYNAVTVVQILSYPIIPIDEGDIYWIDKSGSSGYGEWAAYSIGAMACYIHRPGGSTSDPVKRTGNEKGE